MGFGSWMMIRSASSRASRAGIVGQMDTEPTLAIVPTRTTSTEPWRSSTVACESLATSTRFMTCPDVFSQIKARIVSMPPFAGGKNLPM